MGRRYLPGLPGVLGDTIITTPVLIRGKSMADNANNTSVGRREKWWSVVKAIAFELKPFSLPSVEDVKAAAVTVRTNVRQVTDELVRVTPEAVGAVKAVNPLRALGLLAWLCGWALFIWLEFGKMCVCVNIYIVRELSALKNELRTPWPPLAR